VSKIHGRLLRRDSPDENRVLYYEHVGVNGARLNDSDAVARGRLRRLAHGDVITLPAPTHAESG
jgi:hypothetical protein